MISGIYIGTGFQSTLKFDPAALAAIFILCKLNIFPKLGF